MNVFDAIFLLLPVSAIAAKELLKLKISLWLVFAVWIVVGWLLLNLSVWRHYELLDELVRSTPEPSNELLERWQSDGAPKVFALYFGWAYAAIYFLLCRLLSYVALYIKQLTTNHLRD